MLDTQFIGLNLHFAVNLLAALVAFAVFWLIFDAWTVRREAKEAVKWAGFLALSVGFMLLAAAAQTQAGDVSSLVGRAADALRFLGYLGIVAGQLMDPLQKRPTYGADPLAAITLGADPPAPDKTPRRHNRAFALGPVVGLALPLAAFVVAALYLRRATTGLERHLRPVAWGFGVLTLFELLADAGRLQGVVNPTLAQLVRPYGPVWWLALLTLFIAALILGRWVWRYLTKRLQSQLFIILVSETLALFFFSTVGFTFLLLRNVQNQSLTDLATASRVLQYAVTSQQAETAAQAEAVAGNSAVAAALAARDHTALAAVLASYLQAHNLTTLTVTDATGQVLLRGEDPDRWGDSRSSDPLVRRGVIGETGASVITSDGVVAPTVSLVADSPVRGAGGAVVGVVVAGRAITGAFVDGVRSSTGLDSTIYGGNIRAATTLTTSGSSDRAVGIKETATAVTSQVLGKNHSFTGPVTLQNRAYLAAFTPLRDINNNAVGMLLVARPQDALYAAASDSVQLTFLLVVVLVFLSIYPVYRISRFLAGQLR